MGYQTKKAQATRKRPSLIVTSKPRAEIRRAQIMAANFAYDPNVSADVNKATIYDTLDALGIRACVQGCCK